MHIARHLAVAALVLAGPWRGATATVNASPDDVDVLDTELVAQETGRGPAAVNDTALHWNVWGTDLGHMFEYRDRIYMVFGDTFGAPGRPAPEADDWRSNTMAVTSDSTPEDGLIFDAMVTDAAGHAKELLSSRKVKYDELTVIPTSGTAVGARQYLHYMSVREFDDHGPGTWTTNHSGLAYSDDEGDTWTKAAAPTWGAASNFAQVALVHHDTYVYLFGIPAGRRGGVKLARVPGDLLLDASAYAYWDGTSWVPSEDGASLVVPRPAGELSVRWNSYYGKWLMMYLNVERNAIVVRTADRLTGPWAEERVVVSGLEYPTLYLGSMAPKWNDGPDIWFTMTMFSAYNVFWMRTSLGP